METAVARTSTKGKRKGKRQIKQEQTNTKKQNHENISFVRRLYNRSNWSDTIELLGCISILIIIIIIGINLSLYGYRSYNSIPENAFLARYQRLIYFMISFLGCPTLALPIAMINVLFIAVIGDIIHACVKRYYVVEKKSYRCWETKTGIRIIALAIIAIVWIVIAIEIGHRLLIDLDWNDFLEDRLTMYRLSGCFTLITCSIAFVHNISSYFE